jgi:chorismate mutase
LSKLEHYRQQVQDTDKRILSLIKDWLDIGSNLSEVKRSLDLPIIDSNAEQATMDNLVISATKLEIDVFFARRLELLIEKTIQVQNMDRPMRSKDQNLKDIFELTQEMAAKGKNVTRFEIGEPNFRQSYLQGTEPDRRRILKPRWCFLRVS